MIQVVIVEDEMLVRLGTKLCLEESQEGIRVAESFESAEEALEYFREHTADILITDIRLAGMSGLELIREVKQDHIEMRTIVLSCYEDFAYAREAMELGVDKYLLKHELGVDELARTVRQLYQERRVGHSTGSRREKSMPEKLPGEAAQGYVLGYLVLRGEKDEQNSGAKQLNLSILAEIIQKLLNVGHLGECFLRREEEIFMIFQIEKGISDQEFSEKLGHFFDRLSRNIFNYFNKNTYLFLSGEFKKLGQAGEVFENTKKLSAYSFYYEHSWLFLCERMREGTGICPKLKLKQEVVFTEKWFEENEKNIRSFFFEAGKNLADVVQVKAEVVKYFYALEECLAGCGGVDRKHYSSGDYTSIDAFDSAALLEAWLLELLGQVKNLLSESNDQVKQIENYIQEHYREVMSLERVSAVFHMSMPYFCQYFKKNMGVNFISYLNGFRIQKAKELLKDSALTTEQVAAEIGISNPNYFVRLFKKLTGQTVGTYRKSLK